MAQIVITGATGMIGRAVCAALVARGDTPVALTRSPMRTWAQLPDGMRFEHWPVPRTSPPPPAALDGAAAVINLMGEPVAQRWTESARERIRESRVQGTEQLVAAMRELPADRRPRVLVSQSATGYYGPSDAQVLTEEAPAGQDFLAGVVGAWERAARDAEPIARVALTRTGVVLAPRGGALAKMLPFFRAGVGGPVAGGRQFVPWVHLDDVVSALLFCVDNEGAAGPLNLTAPEPIDNATFSRSLGRVLRRPALLPVPAFALRLLYGQMAEIVTTGQRAVPHRLTELGFSFRYPELEPALRDVLA